MDRIPRTIAVVATIAVVLLHSHPTLPATGAAVEGTVEIPCDPSRISEVATVQIGSVSGGPAVTVAVDPSSGSFLTSGLPEGEYELIAIGTDGEPLSPEPKKLLLHDGMNTIVLSLEPPGCGKRQKRKLKDWHLTLIYVGVVGALILALSDDDDDPASPFEP